jgi:predicted DNA-binding ribbon-helix-helix protein
MPEKATRDADGYRERDRRQALEKSSRHDNSGYLRSRVLKRSIVVGRHRTSVSLEDEFWLELRQIADDRNLQLSQLLARIDAERIHVNLSSAIRLFVFKQRCKGGAAKPVKGRMKKMNR